MTVGYVHVYTRPGAKFALVRGGVKQWLKQENIVASYSRSDEGFHLNKTRLDDLIARLEHSDFTVRFHDSWPTDADIDEARARSLVDTIKTSIEQAREAMIEAYQRRAWKALGYPSWDALCEAEFKVRIALPDRPAAVREMRGAGMSQRAIASGLGVSPGTINRDLRQSPPEALTGTIVGTDGKTYPPVQIAREMPFSDTCMEPDCVRVIGMQHPAVQSLWSTMERALDAKRVLGTTAEELRRWADLMTTLADKMDNL